MVMVSTKLSDEYWESFEVYSDDVEYLYNTLLERETPLTTEELITSLVEERIRREMLALEKQRSAGGDPYLPKENYMVGQKLVFPAYNWQSGSIVDVRPGKNPEIGTFDVIQVQFEHGEKRQFAAGLAEHRLNQPNQAQSESSGLDTLAILDTYGEGLKVVLEDDLGSNPDFVRIAGRWFPRALLVDVNLGHLNLAEAVLDMSGGGPISTSELIEQIELKADVNPKLIEFSLDLALQEDRRFDEVGPAGKVLWYLQRLEPPEVLEPPLYLRYPGIEYERSLLTDGMLALENSLGDELSPISTMQLVQPEVLVNLIYPHWRSGTLPLSTRLRHLFPTAYEAPRIRFMLVDGESGEKFPGWVVPEKRYVYGLREWYNRQGLVPGSQVRVRRGDQPGEVIIDASARRSSREWVRTVLVGSDGGLVFAMLKQVINAVFDERMAIAVPDTEAVDQVWTRMQKERPPFEKTVVNIVRELAKLNPQSHVHASELYAAVNVIRRCPPGPILGLLASRPWFVHVGDLHYRFNDSEYTQ